MSAEINLPARSTRQSVGRFVKSHMRDYGMLLSLVAIVLFFQYMTDGTLLQPLNLTNLVLQNSYIVIMALGMLLVIVAGHIDLSVGSVVAFIGALAAILMVRLHLDFVTTTLLCLMAGAAIGAVQGFWVAYLRIPSFIVTLAGMLVFRGLCLILLAGQSVGPFPVEFQRLSSGFIPDFLAMDVFNVGKFHITSLLLCGALAFALVVLNLATRRRRLAVGIEQEPLALFAVKNLALAAVLVYVGQLMASYRGLPNVLIIMSVLIALYGFVTRNSTVGRRVYALGGNEKAARLSGIDTRRLSFYTFVNMGVLAALAGLIFAARLNTATPKAGVSFELDVIAACFIGGASASGGVGRVTGAVIGAFIMGVMNNGMSILGIGIDWQQVIKGMVLLAAVTIDVYNKNKA
ncbi:multiple monosaccharide ABC transporter permease [Azospirillum rugosum]|uniref:Xylose transport system permease protein XylH n=1 Tax=Azospirillum rugosum TaxID=416170 RepID=A0ABS4SUL5_9PROT|nr:multiple monosaccharide ABC transporter permease [Azospirillum rugosum]MBP2296263.1 putative multiple sugar transport system permease protein [Azospirillum rugosum]MDQ0529784.1 putative multiple sugar transport system permease protein [Azospirillum rugosum]